MASMETTKATISLQTRDELLVIAFSATSSELEQIFFFVERMCIFPLLVKLLLWSTECLIILLDTDFHLNSYSQAAVLSRKKEMSRARNAWTISGE